MSRKSDRAKARVKKETIRTLDLRTLEPSDLAKVAGGTHTWQPRYTRCCG